MSDNLYAPPQADLGTGAPPAIGSGSFDIGRCLSEAWAATWANFPLWLGFGIVWVVVALLATITLIGIIAAVPVLVWGGYVFTLRMHDGGASLGDMFAGFSRYGEALGGMLGFFLVTFLIRLPGNAAVWIGSASSEYGMIAIGYIAVLGLMFFVTARLNFAPFLMVDRGVGLGAALNESWARTADLKLRVAGLMLVMFLVVFLGTLALLVGALPGMMVAYMVWVSAYRQIFGGGPQR